MLQKENDPLLSNNNKGTNTKVSVDHIIDRDNRRQTILKEHLDMHSDGDLDATLKFTIQPETLRFYAYAFFWIMSLTAILLTEFIVRNRLLAGPSSDTKSTSMTCPPFQDGKGFDIHTDSHLIRVYGFNNICSNWDYSPAREIIALIYPIFEYTLILYLVADFVNTLVAYRKGWVSRRYYRVARIAFPIMIVLCSWFRMIFVVLVYENARGHTAGFLGLQWTLMMVASLNVWYIAETKLQYPVLMECCGGRSCSASTTTVVVALAYLFCNLTVSAAKFWLDVHVVAGFAYPSWGLRRVIGSSRDGGLVVGEIVDCFWMLVNAVLPLFISYYRSCHEQPLELTIDLQPPHFVLEKMERRDENVNINGGDP